MPRCFCRPDRHRAGTLRSGSRPSFKFRPVETHQFRFNRSFGKLGMSSRRTTDEKSLGQVSFQATRRMEGPRRRDPRLRLRLFALYRCGQRFLAQPAARLPVRSQFKNAFPHGFHDPDRGTDLVTSDRAREGARCISASRSSVEDLVVERRQAADEQEPPARIRHRACSGQPFEHRGKRLFRYDAGPRRRPRQFAIRFARRRRFRRDCRQSAGQRAGIQRCLLATSERHFQRRRPAIPLATAKSSRRTAISNPADLFENDFFQSFFGQFDADLRTGTSVKTIFRLSPAGDGFCDRPVPGPAGDLRSGPEHPGHAEPADSGPAVPCRRRSSMRETSSIFRPASRARKACLKLNGQRPMLCAAASR